MIQNTNAITIGAGQRLDIRVGYFNIDFEALIFML